MAHNMVKVLKVESGKYPEVVEMENCLSSWQEGVGGYIECVYPFEDNVGLIVNEEGKLNCLPLNRCLRSEDGEIYNIIAGTFFVVGLTEDDFASLTDAEIEKFEKLYHTPEVFVRIDGRIHCLPVEPSKDDDEGDGGNEQDGQ